MDKTKKGIFEEIVGNLDLSSDNFKQRLIYCFNDIDVRFQGLIQERKDSPYLKEIMECYMYISNLYTTIITNCIREFLENIYGKSIDFVLTNYEQSEISFKLEEFLNKKGFPQSFKSDVFDEESDKKSEWTQFQL